MPAGLSPDEREALRKRYLDKAVASAAKTGLTGRCKRVLADLASPDHRLCRGENPGGTGCLCRCHDNPGAVVPGSGIPQYGGRL